LKTDLLESFPQLPQGFKLLLNSFPIEFSIDFDIGSAQNSQLIDDLIAHDDLRRSIDVGWQAEEFRHVGVWQIIDHISIVLFTCAFLHYS
jgi:hypothetical protein